MIKTLAIAAFLAAPTLQTAAPQCLTKRQVADAAMTMTPYLLEAVTDKCRAHLSADSFLNAKGAALHARLKAEGAGREASTALVMMAVMGSDVPAIKDTEALIKVIGAMASGFIAKDIPVESCAGISGMVEALAPLPAENIGLFAASMASAVIESEKRAEKPDAPKADGKLEICKDG
jgi:hypothetical protein